MWMGSQIQHRGGSNLSLFASGNSPDRFPEPSRRPRLDLNKTECLTLQGDSIELSGLELDVATDDAQPLAFEPGDAILFGRSTPCPGVILFVESFERRH